MGLYDGIKDVAKIVQQADNIELYQKLLDLSSQALDMQSTIIALQEENRQLKETKNIEEKIQRHEDTYITLIDDNVDRVYCSTCWDTQKVLIQGQKTGDGMYYCSNCNTRSYCEK